MTTPTWMYLQSESIKARLTEGLWMFQRRSIAAEYADHQEQTYRQVLAAVVRSNAYWGQAEGV